MPACHPLRTCAAPAAAALLAVALTSSLAHAQTASPAGPGTTPPAQAQQDPDKDKGKVKKGVVTASAKLAPRAAKPVPGGLVTVQVLLEIEDGWHIYANPAGDESARPTIVAPEAKAPVTVLGVDYPEGTPSDAGGAGTIVLVYEPKVTIPVRLQLKDDVKPGPLEVKLQVKFQPCNDSACLAPATLTLPVKLTVQAP
jgi:DsbC/DsbD-like thiol-disulfide interchange protein